MGSPPSGSRLSGSHPSGSPASGSPPSGSSPSGSPPRDSPPYLGPPGGRHEVPGPPRRAAPTADRAAGLPGSLAAARLPGSFGFLIIFIAKWAPKPYSNY